MSGNNSQLTADDATRIAESILGKIHVSSPHLSGDTIAMSCLVSDLGKLIEGVAELTREACAKQCESLLDVSVFWDGGSPFIGDPASAAAIKECTSRIRDMEFPLSGFVRKLQEVGDRDD